MSHKSTKFDQENQVRVKRIDEEEYKLDDVIIEEVKDQEQENRVLIRA